MKRKVVYILSIVLILLLQGLYGAKINLYVYPFANLDGDASIDWIGSSFVEFIIQHYRFSKDIVAYDKTKLEEIDSVVIRNTRNYVIDGSYGHYDGTFKVNIEVINIVNWQIESKTTLSFKNIDYGKIFESAIAYLDSVFLSENRDEFERRERSSERRVERKIGEEIRKNITRNFTERKKGYVSRSGFQNVLIDPGEFKAFIDKFFGDMYDVFIEKPVVRVDERNPDFAKIEIGVRYKLKLSQLENIVKKLRFYEKYESEIYITYKIPKRKLFSCYELQMELVAGHYNPYPVIYIMDKEGNNLYVIYDGPFETEGKSESGVKVVVNKFKPLIEVVDETAYISFFLRKEETLVIYKFRVRSDVLLEFETVSIEVLPEKLIYNMLK